MTAAGPRAVGAGAACVAGVEGVEAVAGGAEGGATLGEAQPSASASNNTGAAAAIRRHAPEPPSYAARMGLLLLEVLAVLGIAIFIVWWTMFSGRGKHDAAVPPDDDPRTAGRGGGDSDLRESGGATRGSDKSNGSEGPGPGAD